MMPPPMPGPGDAGASPAVAPDADSTIDVLTGQRELIERLAALLEAGGPARLFETHISWVLVAGAYAWKIKKAVRLPYLDFSTLAARRFYCVEELRLNRRLAPGLYVDVVPVTGTSRHPVLGGEGPALEYAVLMRAFEQQAVWDFRLGHGLLGGEEVDLLAPWLARFHLDAPRAPLGPNGARRRSLPPRLPPRWTSLRSASAAGRGATTWPRCAGGRPDSVPC